MALCQVYQQDQADSRTRNALHCRIFDNASIRAAHDHTSTSAFDRHRKRMFFAFACGLAGHPHDARYLEKNDVASPLCRKQVKLAELLMGNSLGMVELMRMLRITKGWSSETDGSNELWQCTA
jgi:hypothetical protein